MVLMSSRGCEGLTDSPGNVWVVLELGQCAHRMRLESATQPVAGSSDECSPQIYANPCLPLQQPRRQTHVRSRAFNCRHCLFELEPTASPVFGVGGLEVHVCKYLSTSENFSSDSHR
jgi:hypothetical protein